MATYREFREQVKRRRRRKFILRLSLLIVAAAAVCGVAFFALYTVLTGAGWTPGNGGTNGKQRGHCHENERIPKRHGGGSQPTGGHPLGF